METQRQRFGQYEVLGPLGAGGMGEVYLARDPVLGRKVAIKVLAVRLSGDRDTLTRFTQEARSASALNHPNIVTIHEVGMDEGSPYIVMECVDGKDLRVMLASGPLPNRKTLEIASQIAEGLAAAHEQGIIHRDLKPENLMYSKDGFVKIMDFGLAKVVRATPTDTEETLELEMPGTNPGTILGTVGYMSPEQATGKPLDFRSDQFALGAILYELATGRPAFDRDTAIDTLAAILHDDPEPIGRFNAKIPQPFCWIVDRLLSKDREERYNSTRDLARELRTLRERMPTQSSDFEIPRPPMLASKRSRGFAIGAALLLATSGIVWMNRARLHLPAMNAPATASKTYLAVMRFKDLTGDHNGQLVVDGFAETLTARLAHLPAVQVMRPPTPDAASSNDRQQLARELGANVILTGSILRNGDKLRIAYTVFDAAAQSESGDTIDGSFSDLFSAQDKLADSVASALRLGRMTPEPARASIPDDATSQRKYLEALGSMRRYDDEASVDNAIHILESLPANSASIVAALGRAYLYKYNLTHDAAWADRAGTTCENAAKLDAQNADVHYTLGELRRVTGRYPEAISEYKLALAQQPNNADAVLGLAESYKANRSFAAAEQEYLHSIQLQPKFWGAYSKLGAFYYGQARYEQAAAQFRKVIELVPDNVRGYNNLSAMYLAMGRYDDAIAVSNSSIARKPNAQAYSNLGTGYYNTHRYDDAAASFDKAITLDPKNYLYRVNLGDAARNSTTVRAKADAAYDRGIELCRAALAVNPNEVRAHAALAIALAQRGKGAEATSEIARARELQPGNPELAYKAALIANSRHDTASTMKLLDEALRGGYNSAELATDPGFANLRGDAIFQQLLQPQAPGK